MHELRNKINETVKFIKEEMGDMPQPDVAIILGTGLGNLSAKINEKKSLEYRTIPHF